MRLKDTFRAHDKKCLLFFCIYVFLNILTSANVAVVLGSVIFILLKKYIRVALVNRTATLIHGGLARSSEPSPGASGP